MSRFLECDCVYIEDGQAWFVGTNVNALFQMKWGAEECKMLTAFPDYNIISHRKYQRCIKQNDEMFCFPCTGKDIWVYNLNSHTLEKIEIDVKVEKMLVRLAIKIENSIYAVAAGINRIIEVDTVSKKIVGSYQIPINEPVMFIREDYVLLGKKIYFMPFETDGIYEFDYETKEINYIGLPKDCKGACTLCHDGKYFWISNKTKKLFKWDKETGDISEIKDFPEDFGEYQIASDGSFVLNREAEEYENPLFLKSIRCGNFLWLIPYKTNHILYVDVNTCEMRKLEIKEEMENADTWHDSRRVKYRIAAVLDERYIILYSFKQKCYLQIDMERHDVSYIHIEMGIRGAKKIWATLFQKGIVYEQHWFTAGDFLEYISDEDEESNEFIGASCVGEKIYNKV